MGPAFAAVGAGIAALLELTIASRYQIAGAQLQLSLVLAVTVTLVYGFQNGMAWAFVGGLSLDIFAMRPLGSSVFEMLIVVALATVAEPLVSRSRFLGCVVAVAVLTPVFLVVSDLTIGLLSPPAPPIQLTNPNCRRAGEWNARGTRSSTGDWDQEEGGAARARPLVEVTE